MKSENIKPHVFKVKDSKYNTYEDLYLQFQKFDVGIRWAIMFKSCILSNFLLNYSTTFMLVSIPTFSGSRIQKISLILSFV